MGATNKVKAFKELFELVIFYSENRDLPVDPDFNFFKEVEFYCNQLDLNYEEFKETFELKDFF
ncbi:hypothetical protein [Aquibacillus saliphilus]|uniref:hypothetical protein n=1 Tax=Aquibacillus saliphilus TaxID=1909422 RepID=UPI001CF0280E|nr:hypothetical protein [Aquibacillus saliphilus]